MRSMEEAAELQRRGPPEGGPLVRYPSYLTDQVDLRLVSYQSVAAHSARVKLKSAPVRSDP